MKIAITGITGFVGSSMMKVLHNSNHELIVLVKDKLEVPDEIIQKHQVLRVDLSKSVPKLDCDLLIHCAAVVSDKIISFEMNRTNVAGTKRLYEAIPSSARIIHLSCGDVYNIDEKQHVETEDILPKILTPYGRSKYLGEQLVREQFNDRDVIILRPRGIYGAGDRLLLPRLLQIYKDGKVKSAGPMEVNVSMCNVNLLVHTIIKFIDYSFKGIDVFNVADTEIYRLDKIVTKLLSGVLDRSIELKVYNENMVRLYAGLRTILVPGNHITQTSIDYISRHHVLNTEKLYRQFPDLAKLPNFDEAIKEQIAWTKRVGLQQVVNRNKRILWI